jgi:spermidine synthase
LKPWIELGRTTTPDGGDMRLKERDAEYSITVEGRELMSSRAHCSEEELARLACARLGDVKGPRVLVGGLGMGFTLRAALDLLPPDARVTVAELVPAVVEWNRGPLARLANEPLADGRVRLEIADVAESIRAHAGGFHAIVLDVDNGPTAFTSIGNREIYDDAGAAASFRALSAGGRFAVWSAWDDHKYLQRLRSAGFKAESKRVRARGNKGTKHAIFVADK